MSKPNTTAAAALRRHKTVLKLSTGAAALLVAGGFAAPAFAQSTGAQIEEIIVLGERGQRNVSGLIVAEQGQKARSTVTGEYLDTQNAGQTVLQAINLLPGVTFTNSDAYGSEGGSLRLRGFDGPRISLTYDGIQLNDSGNYAIFSNQQVDSELTESVTVAPGTTEVDSPTASAVGGTINIRTRKPYDERRFVAKASVGTDRYRRLFVSADTGTFGPYDTKAFVAASGTEYDKFRGKGEINKKQVNFRVYQALKGDDFISLAGHYNENRNYNYRSDSLANFARFGRGYDWDTTFTPATRRTGVADIEPATTTNGPLGTSSNNGNYFETRLNPSNTGNLRMQSAFQLTDSLRLTVDPSFQYTLATGGSATNILDERDVRLRSAANAANPNAGVDINGDGDVLDRVRITAPNITNTERPGVNASLIWELNEQHRFRIAYTYDRARHRQTGEFGYITADYKPEDVFSGKQGRKITTQDGFTLQSRDRLSFAILNQVAGEYVGKFMDDQLRVFVGLRAPFFERRLNQYCYLANSAPQIPAGFLNNSVCIRPEVLAASGITPTATQVVRAPYSETRKYDDLMPNLGFTYRLTDDIQVFANFAQGLSAPRTDNLYSFANVRPEPETSDTYDFGGRYQGNGVLAAVSGYYTKFYNRIQSSFDQDQGINIDRNVGDVDVWGVDFELGVEPIDDLTINATASWADSEFQSDYRTGATTTVATKGKKLPETPEWQFGGRAQYKIAGFTLGFDGEWVGQREGNDVNSPTERPGAYAVFNADVRYDLTDVLNFGRGKSYVQFNVSNLLDKQYYNRLSAGAGTGALFVSPGAPRTYMLTVQASF